MKKAKYDIFISHASEDKEKFIRPLAEKLTLIGYSVWYDEFELELGSSLSDSIQKGIKESLFGLIVLSENFFNKEWTKLELNAFLSKEILFKEKILLPVWLGVDYEQVFNFNPFLADRLAAVVNNYDVDLAVEKIKQKINLNKVTKEFIKDKVDSIIYSDPFNKDKELIEMLYRFEKIIAFHNEHDYYVDFYIENESIEETESNEEFYTNLFEEIRLRYNLPKEVWLDEIDFLDDSVYKDAKKSIKKFAFGEMTTDEFEVFYDLLENLIDTDVSYILLGIPNGYINKLKNDYEFFYKQINRLATDDI